MNAHAFFKTETLFQKCLKEFDAGRLDGETLIRLKDNFFDMILSVSDCIQDRDMKLLSAQIAYQILTFNMKQNDWKKILLEDIKSADRQIKQIIAHENFESTATNNDLLIAA